MTTKDKVIAVGITALLAFGLFLSFYPFAPKDATLGAQYTEQAKFQMILPASTTRSSFIGTDNINYYPFSLIAARLFFAIETKTIAEGANDPLFDIEVSNSEGTKVIHQGIDMSQDYAYKLGFGIGGGADDFSAVPFITIPTTATTRGNVGFYDDFPVNRLSIKGAEYHNDADISLTATSTLSDFPWTLGVDATDRIFKISEGLVLGTDDVFRASSTMLELLPAPSGTTSTISCGGSTHPCCERKRDVDDGGWSYCTYLNGVMTCSTDSCE